MSQATRIGATLGASLILALSACTDAQADGWTGRAHQNPQAPEGPEMSKYITIPERLAPWREAYETDPAVNQAVIAAHIGCRESTVCDHIRRLGWVVPAHVRAARARVKPAPLILSGRAAPSVWAWAQGVTVSTARHGGRHVKMPAGRPASSVWALAEGGAA